MTAEPSWDTPRWRESGHRPAHDRSHTTQPFPLSAPTAINPASQSAILEQHRSWDNSGQTFREQRPVQQHQLTEAHTDASALPKLLYERHSPAPGGKYDPQQSTKTSSHQPPTGAWWSLHDDDHRAFTTHVPGAPLTLHIPKSQDPPRLSPGYSLVKSEGQPYPKAAITPSSIVPSLPSFASFQEHASRPDDDGPEMAPMAARLSCFLCTKLRPMVREVAIAAAELDENVQSYCNRAVTRTLDIPSESPVRTVQWTLERLRLAKHDVIEAGRRAQQPNYYFPHPPAPVGPTSRASSPSATSLKRQPGWDVEDYPAAKRPRPEDSPDRAMFDRRASLDFPARNARSPLLTESAPISAYPRSGSPALGGRALRPLPSPSSLAYPASAAPSLPPPTVHPGSPAPSYSASASIHTASTNSATSAHIADLQHQVTLKSLALQTLQSEYSGMLQKLQRERIKSQTIEKKTTVSELEVNDLTGRNEELAEQVKSLEVQLEECERRRDGERAEAAKEKEQWGRMLDMSSRLQAKLSADRQNLVEERNDLRKRTVGVEDRRLGSTTTPLFSSADRSDMKAADHGAERRESLYGNASSDAVGLKHEVGLLRARNEVLTSVLHEAKRHNQDIGGQSRNAAQASGEIEKAISRAFDSEETGDHKQGTANPSPNSHQPTPTTSRTQAEQTKAQATGPPIVISTASSPSALPSITGSHSGARSGLPTPLSATAPSIAEMARAGRALSPGAEELGINVQPSTSTPEELIQALGPVPAPLPPFRFQPSSMHIQSALPAKQSSRSPPAAQMYAHASPYDRLQSQWAHRSIQQAHGGASPPSNRSSPGVAPDDESPPNGPYSARRRSSEANLLAPSGGGRRAITDNALKHAGTMRKFPENSNGSATGLASFRQWSHDGRQADYPGSMPPPPRPSTTAQSMTFEPTSRV